MFNFRHSKQIVWQLVSVNKCYGYMDGFYACIYYYNPIIENVIAFRLFAATSQHFGFVGGGTLFVLQLNENGSINETKSFEWSDGLFDIVSINL